MHRLSIRRATVWPSVLVAVALATVAAVTVASASSQPRAASAATTSYGGAAELMTRFYACICRHAPVSLAIDHRPLDHSQRQKHRGGVSAPLGTGEARKAEALVVRHRVGLRVHGDPDAANPLGLVDRDVERESHKSFADSTSLPLRSKGGG